MRVVAVALLSLCALGLAAAPPAQPTFYRDVQPILQKHCQPCHRPGEIGPMPLLTFAQTRPWAKAIREAVITRKMPPWFADPAYGHFANDPSLPAADVETVKAWVDTGAPSGSLRTAPQPRTWPEQWNIGTPGAVFVMPQSIAIPAARELDYQYLILPTGFTADRWVQKAEMRPGNPAVVHHAVAYIREPGSPWLRDKPPGVPFSLPPSAPNTRSDILFTYTPGNPIGEWPGGMAKLIPAGSDIVLQMHYTPLGKPATDRTRLGIVFAPGRPARRVLTLQLNSNGFLIPPGHPNYRVHVFGTLPNDAVLLSLYPHMHLRGRSFEYAIDQPDGHRNILLKVDNYDFYWQLTYRLQTPLLLKAGTRLEAAALFDNSRNNPRNPDPDAAVRYGEQSGDEMMIGFFDVAVDSHIDKPKFFERSVR